MNDFKTVLLANGDFPDTDRTLSILRGAERIVCCDGAIAALDEIGMKPAAIVGDLDSISPDLKARYAKSIVHVPEQESNDLCKAFRFCMTQGWSNIAILGATGKREDHALGNISHLADFGRMVPGIRMFTDYGEFFPLMQSGTVACRPGQQVSIFAMSPETSISSAGLKYPLRGLELHRWWQATLNEALSNSFQLSFEGQEPLIVFLAV